MSAPLTFETSGDRQIVVTRDFRAPPMFVYRAHIDPAILPRWMTGPEGWAMRIDTHDPVPDGLFKYTYTGEQGQSFAIAGRFLSLAEGARIEHVQHMLMPDPTPELHQETVFASRGSGTRLTVTLTLPDRRARDALAGSGSMAGMERSFEKLDALDID